MAGEFEIVERSDGVWTWRLKAGNGVVIAESDQSFVSRSDAERAVATVAANVAAIAATDENDETPAENDEAPDWSKGLLALAGAMVVGVLAAIGVSGDLLVRLVRNDPYKVAVPLILLLIAGGVVGMAFALQSTSRVVKWSLMGSTAVATILLCGVAWMGANSQDDRELPSVQLHLEEGDHGLSIRATASGTTLKSSETMLLQVLELPDPIDEFEVLRNVCTDARDIPDVKYDGRVVVLSWTEVGPNAKGEASTEVSLPIGESRTDVHFCALAQLVGRNDSVPQFAWSEINIPAVAEE